MPKPQIISQPPSGNSGNTQANQHHNLTPSVSTSSTSGHQAYLAADLRREKSSSSFTPATVISGPIPPLPKRNHLPSLTTRDSNASLREREYSQSLARRPPSRDPSGGSANSSYNPYSSLSPNSIPSHSPNSASHYAPDSGSPSSPTMSLTSSFSPSISSHMSTQSTSTLATHNTPRGSVSSVRHPEISNPVITHIPNSIPPSARSSLYSSVDEHNSSQATRTGKPTPEFHFDRPTDDAVIEQMFNDLIVS